MQAWLPAPQLWSSSLTQGAIQLGATQLSRWVVGSSDSNLWSGPAETWVYRPQPFIYFPHSPILGQGCWLSLGNLVNAGGGRHLCLSSTRVSRLFQWHGGYRSPRVWAPASLAKQHTHTNMCTDRFSFCGFAKWFFIDSIDWAFPPHLSSSGISCAAKEYGSPPPGQEIFGSAHWSESTTPSAPAINQRRINGFALPSNALDSQSGPFKLCMCVNV